MSQNEKQPTKEDLMKAMQDILAAQKADKELLEQKQGRKTSVSTAEGEQVSTDTVGAQASDKVEPVEPVKASETPLVPKKGRFDWLKKKPKEAKKDEPPVPKRPIEAKSKKGLAFNLIGKKKKNRELFIQIPGEGETEKEIEKLPEEDKERLGLGLSTIGFKVEEMKNNFFATVLNPDTDMVGSRINKKGTVGRFLKELRDSFIKDAEVARKKGLAVQYEKDKAKLRNVSLLTGNVLKYGRILADVVGASIANPLRYVMMGGMVTTRLAEAGKEARLANEEVLDKTRITDADKAAEEAWTIYEEAQKESGNGKVSAEMLEEKYLQKIPEDIQRRLHNPSTANNFIQKILKFDMRTGMNYMNMEAYKIQFNEKLSAVEKNEALKKLNKKYEKTLRDYDAILTQYGTVDALAMAGRYAQTVGKTVVGAMQVETLVISAEKLWEHLSNALASHEIPNTHPETSAPRAITQNPPATPTSSPAPSGGGNTAEEITKAKIEATRRELERQNNIPRPASPTPAPEPQSPPAEPPALPPGVTPSAPEPAVPVLPNNSPTVVIPEGQTHAIHRSWYDNDTKAFDKNELQTHWGGEKSAGIDTNGNYVLDISKMTTGGSTHGALSANVQELLKEGKLKMLISASKETQNQVFEVPIDANGHIVIDPNSDIGKMFFANVNGHAQFTGRFGEIGQDMGNNNFRILSTIEGGGVKNAAEINPETETPIATPEPAAVNIPKTLPTSHLETPDELRAGEIHQTIPEPVPAQTTVAEEIAQARANVLASYQKAEPDIIPQRENVYWGGTDKEHPGERGAPLWGGTPLGQYWGGTPIRPPGIYHPLSELHTLSPEMLHQQVNDVYENNLHRIFPEDTAELWTKYLKNSNASTIVDDYVKKDGIPNYNPEYQPFISYMKKLHEVTHLDPRPKTILFGEAETVEEYMKRALEEAAKHPGRLDEIKNFADHLKHTEPVNVQTGPQNLLPDSDLPRNSLKKLE